VWRSIDALSLLFSKKILTLQAFKIVRTSNVLGLIKGIFGVYTQEADLGNGIALVLAVRECLLFRKQ
jgi:hypothetical protein